MLCPICAQENEVSATACRGCGTPLGPSEAAATPLLSAGATLQFGSYEIIGVLGRGGFGIVYEGLDVRLKRKVAIKEFLGGDNGSPGDASHQQFLEEAQLLARFNHPNIINVFTAFLENGTVYMVTELLEGRSLQGIVENSGPLDQETALAIMGKVCDALGVIHFAGVLHRDIKPENIIRCIDGRIVLIDFGIARETDDSGVADPIALTPGFAPLEQYSKQAKLGVYTDIYALGATLYFLLTGKIPVDAADRARRVELSPPNTIEPSIGPQINKAILWAMEMRVEDRPANVRAWVDMLFAKFELDRTATPQASPSLSRAPKMQPLRVLSGHNAAVTVVVFSSDGTHLATGSKDHTVNIWATDSWTHLRKFKHTDRITALAASPDNLLVSAGFEGTINVWNLSNGNLVREMQVPLLTQLFVTYSSTESLALAPDGATLFAATGSLILVWNISGGQLIRQVRRPVHFVAVSPDGTLLACCIDHGTDRSIELWRTHDDRVLFTIATKIKAPTALCFSPDNRHLACGLSDGSILNWNLEDKKQSCGQNSGQSVLSLAFSPDGKILASAGANGMVYLWRTTEAGLINSFPAHGDAINALAFSPDSTLLATASGDATVKLWRIL